MTSTVAVLRTSPERALEDYQRLYELAGFRQALDPLADTIIKDNISWHFPFPSANTTPWQLEGSILALRGAGFERISCVQNKTVVTNAFKGTDLNGYYPICQAYGVPVLFNFRNQDMHWVRYQPRARMNVLNRIYPDGIFIPDYFEGRNVVHLPTAKTHIYTTTTGAMKNAFGGLLNHHRHYTHSWIHETLVDLLAIQKEIHSGIFAAMDGTTAGDGAGPRIMTPQVKSIILASADQVAIDAVAARLMGFQPMNITYLRMATEQGLGTANARDIELVGDDVSGENWHFHVGKSFHAMLGRLAWFSPLKVLQNVIFHNPIGETGTSLVSEVYHDYYRWNLRERRLYEQWQAGTAWGRHFARYKREGYLGKPAAAVA
ncbi:MAG TPA: DUF362 domain-containing protein [Chloroflexota bacterium]|nr:DUF362 domain-containing protein [Chloroflexota bacterium]